MRIDIVSVSAEFSYGTVAFSIEASEPFGPRALGFRADPDHRDGLYALHFLADTLRDRRGFEIRIEIGYSEDYARYSAKIYDLTGARFINTEPSASVLRPSPTVLTVVVPTSALPRTQYLIDLYFAARYQRFNHDLDSIVEVERAPDHQRAGPARELDL